MKFLNSIYFHVYNAYYKDGNYTSDIPHLTAFGIVGCSFSLLLAVIVSLLNYSLNESRLSFELIIGVLVLGLILFIFLFLFQKKYEKIYEDIKGSELDSLPIKVLSWLIVATGFATVGLYAYLFNQPPK